MKRLDKNNKQAIEKEVERRIGEDIKKLNLDLVDVEYLQDGGYWYLRIFVERIAGEMGLDDCVELSRLIDPKLEGLVDEKFFLEVSSPGIERPLKKLADFERFCGSKVRLILKHKIDDMRNIKGLIKEVSGEVITLTVDEKEYKVPYNEIKKANIVFEFE